MPLFNISFPANVSYFYSLILSVTNFDIIPTSKLMNYLFNFERTDAYAPNFKELDIF
jgi:hypothetical protein